MESQQQQKKESWAKPMLTRFGSVEDITLACPPGKVCKEKSPGGHDDFGNGVTNC